MPSNAEVSNVLDLYPSSMSQTLVEDFRDMWVERTAKTPQGDWSCWIGANARQVSRSELAWARGK